MTYYKEIEHDGIIYNCTLKMTAIGYPATLTLERNPKSKGRHWLDGFGGDGSKWMRWEYETPNFQGTFEPSGMFILDINEMELINY